jgi:acetoin utilization deacetylase AcuC-like enzyme
MKTRIVYSDKCLGYGTWHVEGPQRIKVAKDILVDRGYEFVEPEPATEDQIMSVHDLEYIWNLKKGLVEDSDTPAYDKIFEFAKLSVGGAILASKINGFSLTRPPGHHVGRYGAALGVYTRGFCYLNNIAIAVKELNKPTLILDIDGHHGNGTQEVFLGDPKVSYVSVHQSPNFPGTGGSSEGNCINFGLPRDSGEEIYLATLDKALSLVDLSKFEVLAVSVGGDTALSDLASLALTEKSFYQIGQRIGKLGKSTFFVFEGGYIGDKNGVNIDNLLRGFEGEKPFF